MLPRFPRHEQLYSRIRPWTLRLQACAVAICHSDHTLHTSLRPHITRAHVYGMYLLIVDAYELCICIYACIYTGDLFVNSAFDRSTDTHTWDTLTNSGNGVGQTGNLTVTVDACYLRLMTYNYQEDSQQPRITASIGTSSLTANSLVNGSFTIPNFGASFAFGTRTLPVFIFRGF